MLLPFAIRCVTLRQSPSGPPAGSQDRVRMQVRFLTAEQAADLLQTDAGTLRRLARERRIPAMKIGREWRFDPALLREWIREQ